MSHNLRHVQDVEPISRIERDEDECEGGDPAVVDNSECARRGRGRLRLSPVLGVSWAALSSKTQKINRNISYKN